LDKAARAEALVIENARLRDKVGDVIRLIDCVIHHPQGYAGGIPLLGVGTVENIKEELILIIDGEGVPKGESGG